MSKRETKLLVDGDVLVTPHFSGIGHYTLHLMYALDRYIEKDPSLHITIFVYFKNLKKAKSYQFRNIKIIPSFFSQRIANALKIRNKQPHLDLFFGKGIYLFPNFTSWPLLRSKSISFIYDLSYELYKQYAEPRNQAFLSSQTKKTVSRSSLIATISQNSKNELCGFYSLEPSRVKIFYPAVDQTIYYRRSTKDIEKTKKKYGIKGEYILFVGNIEPRKNIKNILLAYEQLSQDLRKKYSLLLVGAKGWQDGEIFTIVERLKETGNRVIFPNSYVPDEDLPALYSGASVFAYPSIYEGFGIPPLEAMACGTPVVSADNSSLPEAVGEAGILVNALSVKDISDAIANIVTHEKLREKMIEKGYQQVDSFSWDKEAEKFAQAVKELGINNA